MIKRLIENLSILRLDDFLSDSEKFDVFITCGSFEKRCITSSSIFAKKNVKIGKSIIFNYKETDIRKQKEKNIKKIKKNLKKVSDCVHVFRPGSASLPAEGIGRFVNFLEKKQFDLQNSEVIVDITVFTKPYFFLMLKVLEEKFGLSKFQVLYTEPESYTRETNSGEIVLTEGLDRIETIPGFFGSSVYPEDTLVVILGFEGKRSMEVFNNITPQNTYAVIGFPSYQPGWHKKSIEQNMRFLNESRATDHLHFAPAIDPFETEKLLSGIVSVRENKESNTIIAPLGTKMQALGTFLYAVKDSTAKIVYPFPSTFKPDYSKGNRHTWICQVNLQTFHLRA
jgi:hypothetical protein